MFEFIAQGPHAASTTEVTEEHEEVQYIDLTRSQLSSILEILESHSRIHVFVRVVPQTSYDQPEKQYGVTIKTKDNEHLQEIFNAIMELDDDNEEDPGDIGDLELEENLDPEQPDPIPVPEG